MKKAKNLLLILVILTLAAYATGSSLNQAVSDIAIELAIKEYKEIGSVTAKGNMIGIQPYMTMADYASEITFYKKIDGYLSYLNNKGILMDKTVIVFPEYLGTWLVIANEKEKVVNAQSLKEAMSDIVWNNFFTFIKEYIFAEDVLDKVAYSIFRMKSELMAQIYHSTFSVLSEKYNVTIVAGSIVLANPWISDGALVVRDGPLYNVTVLYGPDGKPFNDIVKKTHPIRDEVPFTAKGKVQDIPVYDLSIGRTGVLICADSWFPGTYEVLKTKNVQYLAVPSFLTKALAMKEAFKGYGIIGPEKPGDYDTKDKGTIAFDEAWFKYSMAGRIKTSGAIAGINVFYRGPLMDIGTDGYTIVSENATTHVGQQVEGCSIICLWL